MSPLRYTNIRFSFQMLEISIDKNKNRERIICEIETSLVLQFAYDFVT